MSNLPEHLRMARFKMMNDMPYFSTALWRLNPIEVESTETPFPAAVDKDLNLYYNMELLEDFSIEEVKSILVHEIYHVLRGHCERAEDMNIDHGMRMLWNVAADMEINDDLQHLSLPERTVKPSDFDLEENKMAEEYYRELQDHEDVEIKEVHCGSCAHGCEEEYEVPGESGERQEMSETDKEIIRQKTAKDIQKNRGNVPGGVERWADDRLNPKVNWRKELSSKISREIDRKAGQSMYTHQRPNRRQESYGEILIPSLVDSTVNISVVIDTSGSMSEEELGQAISEVGSILRSSGDNVSVISCDADSHNIQEVFHPQQIKLEGGGGTDMREGIYAALEEGTPDIIVVVTDGDTPWPKSKPGCDVIACLTDGERDVPGWIQKVVIDQV